VISNGGADFLFWTYCYKMQMVWDVTKADRQSKFEFAVLMYMKIEDDGEGGGGDDYDHVCIFW
jgi:hypothetical protein